MDDRTASLEVVHRPADVRFDEFHAIDADCFPDEPMSRESFETIAQSEFWIARRGGRLVGHSYMRLTEELAWIARLGVASSERNRGVGSALMAAMLDRCRTIGRATVILYVLQDNQPALHLYRKCGFEISEESTQYIGRSTGS